MDHLSRIAIFVAVLQERSFAGAARKLGITGSAVSKQIQNLEHDLQVKLLNRTTRSVTPTEEGAVYFDRAKQALDDLKEAREELLELKSRPHGPLKIGLPHSLGIKYLTDCVARFADEYPEVALDVNLDDRYVDLVNEGYDVVVRIGALKDTSLVARRLASCPLFLCASPAYLKRHGVPDKPADLADHNVLAYTANSAIHEWRYRTPEQERGQVSLSGTFRSNSGDILCQSAVEGVGIVMLPVFYLAEHLKQGRLVRLFPDYTTWPERDIHAVFRPNRYQSARLRLFIDHLVAACRGLPW
ncbi:LysR family transcriptional regulator [Coralliovum pocilloporae]|uniref:LysR family transcriptional regulator n=1 Tax=Coralliovum pocilloporae TaxID=3066369 RepID=UPI0033069E60